MVRDDNLVKRDTVIKIIALLILFNIGLTGQVIDSSKEKPTKVAEKHRIYRYSNDTLSQVVEIFWKKGDSVFFKYSRENTKRKIKYTLQGIAKNLFPNDDPEMDEDENGEGYPADEYYIEGKDGTSLRIAFDHSKMRIKGGKKDDPLCPFESVGVLRNKKK